MATIGIENLTAQIEKELTVYSTEVTEQVNNLSKKYASVLVKKTKATAPVGNRKKHKYKDSIKSKKINETPRGATYAWYVDSKDSNYRLSHLLVHGHALRDGGRTRANDFLKKATDEIEEEYLKAVEEVLKNG